MVGVVGAGAGFRVVLHAEQGLAAVGQGGHGAVIEVVVGHLHQLGRQGGPIEGKAVVLAGDLDQARAATGVVKAPVAVAELVGLAAQGQAQDLVAQADAKHGQVHLLHQAPGQGDATGNGRRIARAIGEEHPLGL